VVTTPESTGEVTAILYEGSVEENDNQELYLYTSGVRRGYAYSVNGGGGSGDTCQATWNVDVTGCESVTRRS
jgi:hypothetical protein